MVKSLSKPPQLTPSATKGWQRKPEQRPDAILDSAAHCFKNNGFASTKIEDIAIGAGLSKGAIYLYFKSKEAILKAVVERAVLPLAKQIEHLANIDDPAQVIPTLNLIIELVGKQIQDPKIAAIPLLIIAEAGNFPDIAKYYRQTVLDRIISAFCGLLDKGIQAGLFRKTLNSEYAVRTLMGGIFLQLVWLHVFEKDDPDPLNISDLLEHHLDLFLKGISAP